MAKKKQPTDSTLRNVRAANKKIAILEARVKALEAILISSRATDAEPEPKADA